VQPESIKNSCYAIQKYMILMYLTVTEFYFLISYRRSMIFKKTMSKTK